MCHLKPLHLLRFWAHQVFFQDFDLSEGAKENLHIRHCHTGGRMGFQYIGGIITNGYACCYVCRGWKWCFGLQFYIGHGHKLMKSIGAPRPPTKPPLIDYKDMSKKCYTQTTDPNILGD